MTTWDVLFCFTNPNSLAPSTQQKGRLETASRAKLEEKERDRRTRRGQQEDKVWRLAVCRGQPGVNKRTTGGQEEDKRRTTGRQDEDKRRKREKKDDNSRTRSGDRLVAAAKLHTKRSPGTLFTRDGLVRRAFWRTCAGGCNISPEDTI